MPRVMHKRIEDLVEGELVNGCLRIRRIVDSRFYRLKDSPAGYVRKNLEGWVNGSHKDAESYVPHSSAVFMDLETRGLSYHNQVWLVGAGYVKAGKLVLDLLLARDPLLERSILQKFMSMSKKRKNTISFNGRTFDIKRMTRRIIAHRLYDPNHPLFDHCRHIDVYPIFRHAAKDLGLKSAALKQFEKAAFPRFKRENHIDGSEIPDAYLEYIRGGSAEKLLAAVEHNAYDLISLAALYLMSIEKGF